MSSSATEQQRQQQQYVVPARLARGVKLAIVMELCHLGSLFSMIGQVSLHSRFDKVHRPFTTYVPLYDTCMCIPQILTSLTTTHRASI